MSKAEEAALKAYPTKYREIPIGYFVPINKYVTERACFVQGYEQAEKDLGWHSVDECLPEIDEEVIVLKDILVEDGLKVGFGKIAFGHIVDTERCIDYNGWNIPGVRFWMPCPKMPEE